MHNSVASVMKTVLVSILAVQFSGCGTILYPERRGKEPGRLDVGVVLLDAFWLLVGIIPGIIAFAVDFSTGAIYIPERSAQGEDGMRTVRFDPETTTYQQLEELIRRETGGEFSFSDERLQLTRVKDKEEAAAVLAATGR